AVLVETLRPGRAAGLLVGRDDEANRLLDLLAPDPAPDIEPDPETTGRAVVVSAVAGMGGIGKTVLAVHTALTAAGRGWFPGGVLLLDLRGYDPGQVPAVRPEQVYASLLRELGLPAEQIPALPTEQAGVYHRVLGQLAGAGERVLLVLDNVAEPAQVQDLLPRHPAHRALVTTRDVLDLPRARRMFLDVLSEPAAADLLTRLLRASDPQDLRPTEEAEAVARLTGLCGRLPLAVEIVAAILTDEPALAITSLADQLGDAETRLDAMDYGGRNVTAVIDFSYRRLAAGVPEAAELLALLTVNPGPDLSTDTAAALAGTPVVVAAKRLRALRAASLLQHTRTGRWKLHDLIALYARHHLAPDTTAPATTRLLDYYTHIVHAADKHLRALPGQPVPAQFTSRGEALAWFDAEHTNLTAAVAHAHHTGHRDTVALATCLQEYLTWRHYLTEQVTVATHAATAATALDDPHARAIALNNLGIALQKVRRFDESITAHQTARDLFRELGDRHREGQAWNNLGVALREVRRFDEAITAHQTARDLYQELGDRHSEGGAWNNLGNALQQVRRFEEAIAAYQTARDICQELGDRNREGGAWNNIGVALREVRRFEEAIAAYQTARDIHRELGDRNSEGTAWNNLGVALREVCRFDEAIAAYQTARDIYRELGNRNRESGVWNNLGIALQKVQRFDEAIAAHQTARDLYRELGDRHSEGGAWKALGNALQKVRRFDDAARAWGEAAAAFDDSGDEESAVRVRQLLEDLRPWRNTGSA
ncbi:tetratricopeptide repeat protein, partial [Amycolatopsis circi]|uniref:tetratricopeptide repeat protein n=1 Tax=Amycolatopsis circi TaxID=871959 RepID=UPI001ABFADD3